VRWRRFDLELRAAKSLVLLEIDSAEYLTGYDRSDTQHYFDLDVFMRIKRA